MRWDYRFRIFYALAGNIAINNCFNLRAIHAAVAAEPGRMRVPLPDYLSPGSFGSLELLPRESTEFIGQAIDYREAAMTEVARVNLDSLGLARVDLIKIDVEGMELEVLEGAATIIARQRPILMVEWYKSDKAKLRARLVDLGYTVLESGLIYLAVHGTDPCVDHIHSTAPPG
jgi:FkbM family methyltransferase